MSIEQIVSDIKEAKAARDQKALVRLAAKLALEQSAWNTVPLTDEHAGRETRYVCGIY